MEWKMKEMEWKYRYHAHNFPTTNLVEITHLCQRLHIKLLRKVPRSKLIVIEQKKTIKYLWNGNEMEWKYRYSRVNRGPRSQVTISLWPILRYHNLVVRNYVQSCKNCLVYRYIWTQKAIKYLYCLRNILGKSLCFILSFDCGEKTD
jgi:hypothetical protein